MKVNPNFQKNKTFPSKTNNSFQTFIAKNIIQTVPPASHFQMFATNILRQIKPQSNNLNSKKYQPVKERSLILAVKVPLSPIILRPNNSHPFQLQKQISFIINREKHFNLDLKLKHRHF